MVCYVTLCYVILCYAMLCYAVVLVTYFQNVVVGFVTDMKWRCPCYSESYLVDESSGSLNLLSAEECVASISPAYAHLHVSACSPGFFGFELCCFVTCDT
jgi:hypothetical protein